MLGIGEMARVSGLGVSALRFYDQAGVLVPALVDPVTGYRRYRDAQVHAARLVAGLRRVGMPVAEIGRLIGETDRAVRGKLLDEHLARLAAGLDDARREIARLHRLIDSDPLEDLPMTTLVTLPAAALAAALDSVRYAAGTDPALPMINGVLLEVGAGELTLVATDRFRLALARPAATVDGPGLAVVAPLPFVDALRPLLAGEAGDATLELTAGSLAARTAAGALTAEPSDVDFPDFRRLVPPAGASRVPVEAAELRAAVAQAPAARREHEGVSFEVAVLTLGADGGVRTADETSWAADTQAHIAVNREFLLQALDAGGAGQLVLELDGPIRPLALRGDGNYSMLMPVRH